MESETPPCKSVLQCHLALRLETVWGFEQQTLSLPKDPRQCQKTKGMNTGRQITFNNKSRVNPTDCDFRLFDSCALWAHSPLYELYDMLSRMVARILFFMNVLWSPLAS
eukprot:2973265-Amphidinium_carterae.1